MIKTSEYPEIPGAVLQTVTGEISVEEIEGATILANGIINKVIDKYGTFNLIVDARGIRFEDLAAHRTWKTTGDRYPEIMARMKYFALVLDDSANARLEKELMETGTWKFFFDFDEGLNWMKKMAGRE